MKRRKRLKLRRLSRRLRRSDKLNYKRKGNWPKPRSKLVLKLNKRQRPKLRGLLLKRKLPD